MSVRGFSWVEQNEEGLEDLVSSFKRAQGGDGAPAPCGRALVITGAGCSVSAGIPTARQIAQKCAVDLWCNLDHSRGVNELGGTLEA